MAVVLFPLRLWIFEYVELLSNLYVMLSLIFFNLGFRFRNLEVLADLLIFHFKILVDLYVKSLVHGFVFASRIWIHRIINLVVLFFYFWRWGVGQLFLAGFFALAGQDEELRVVFACFRLLRGVFDTFFE